MAGISKKKIKKGDKVIIKYTISYRDVLGKQHTKGLYDTIKEAKRHLAEFEKVEANDNITYGTIFKKFLKRCENKCSYGTNLNYKNAYEYFFKKFDDVKYKKITSLEWENYFNESSKEKSPYAINYAISFAKSAVNYAIKHNLINNNIFDKIDKIDTPQADINHLNLKELKLILEKCKKAYPQYYTLLFTFIGTGAREGEIFALTKEDFDPINKTLKINKQFTRGKIFPHPKTKKSNRVIYIFNELNEILKNHIKTLPSNCDLLFPNSKGNYQHASNFRKRFFKPLLKLCKIEKRVRVHDLRGSYIDMTLSNGLSVKFAQNQAGHSKIEMTLNTYAKNNQDMIDNALEKIDNIFNKKCENFVRTKNLPPNNKIIHFPKKSMDSCF